MSKFVDVHVIDDMTEENLALLKVVWETRPYTDDHKWQMNFAALCGKMESYLEYIKMQQDKDK